MQEDDEHNPAQSVMAAPFPDITRVTAHHYIHTDTRQHSCLGCGMNFARRQERERHLRLFMPNWIYYPAPSIQVRPSQQFSQTLAKETRRERSSTSTAAVPNIRSGLRVVGGNGYQWSDVYGVASCRRPSALREHSRGHEIDRGVL